MIKLKLILNIVNLTYSIKLLIIVIGIGAIIKLLLPNDQSNMDKYLGPSQLSILYKILKKTLFYIPCLVADFIAYITNTAKNTKMFVLVVLLIELMLLFSSIIIPVLNKWIAKHLGSVILDKPIYLDNNNNSHEDLDYYNNSADELLFLDTVASLYGRNNVGGIGPNVQSTHRRHRIP